MTIEANEQTQLTTEIEVEVTDPVDESTSDETSTEEENVPAPTSEEEKSAVQKRINAMTKEKYELKQKLAAAEAKLASQPVDPLTVTPETLQDLVHKEATRLAQETNFNNRCNSIFTEAVSKLPTFAEDINTLNSIGLVANKDLFDSVVESDVAADILVYLADNLEEAENLINLPVRSMYRELAKLEVKLADTPIVAKKPVSKAPAPIKPVASRGVVTEIDVEKNPSAWIAQRNKELALKRKGK